MFDSLRSWYRPGRRPARQSHARPARRRVRPQVELLERRDLLTNAIFSSLIAGGNLGNVHVTQPDVGALAGDYIVVGSTSSPNLPVTGLTPAGHAAPIGGIDVYVAVISPTTGAIIWAGYYGGFGNDIANDVTFDTNEGDIFITGSTTSTNLATTGAGGSTAAPAANSTLNGGANTVNTDAFFLDVTPTGFEQLAEYYGGSANDVGNGIAYSTFTGNPYIVGTTSSGTGGATDIQGPLVNGSSGGQDAFVVEINETTGAVVIGRYFGGSGDEFGNDIVISTNSDAVVIVGTTTTNNSAAPATPFPLNTAAQGTYGGGASDAFWADFDNTLINQISTYFGGTGADTGNSIAVNDAFPRTLYITGSTNSPDAAAIATPGAAQPALAGGTDAYVEQYDLPNTPTGARLAGTYLGGSDNDVGNEIIVDSATGRVAVGGGTASFNFPVTVGGLNGALLGSVQSKFGLGTQDGFVTALDGALTTKLVSSYLGGTGDDVVTGLFFDGASLEVAGSTTSLNFLNTNVAGSQATGADGFLVKASDAATKPLLVSIGTDGNAYVETTSAGNPDATRNGIPEGTYQLLDTRQIHDVVQATDPFNGNLPVLFGLSSDNQVYMLKTDDAGNPATGWVKLPSSATTGFSAIEVTTDTVGRPFLIALGLDGTVSYLNFSDSGAAAPFQKLQPQGSFLTLAGGQVTAVVLTNDSAGNPFLLMLAGSVGVNKLYFQRFTVVGGFEVPQGTPTYAVNDPANNFGGNFSSFTLTTFAGEPYVVGINSDNGHLYYMKFDTTIAFPAPPATTTWLPIPGAPAGVKFTDVVLTLDGSGNPFLAALGSDKHVYASTFDATGAPTGGGLFRLDLAGFMAFQSLQFAPGNVSGGNPVLFAVGTDKQVYEMQFSGTDAPTSPSFALPGGGGTVLNFTVVTDGTLLRLYSTGTDDRTRYMLFDATNTPTTTWVEGGAGTVLSVEAVPELG